MNHAIALGAAMLTVLAVTSCAAPQDPVSSVPPTTSGTPTLGPTPAVDPANMSMWVISESGIGPMRLGVTLADATAAVPHLNRPADDLCAYPEYLTLALPGGSSLDPEVRLEADRQTGLVTLIATSRSGPLTASGIGVGSTLSDVVAAYPDAQALEVAADQFVYTVPGEPGWITFVPDGSASIATVWVQAGRGSGSEGCA